MVIREDMIVGHYTAVGDCMVIEICVTIGDRIVVEDSIAMDALCS